MPHKYLGKEISNKGATWLERWLHLESKQNLHAFPCTLIILPFPPSFFFPYSLGFPCPRVHCVQVSSSKFQNYGYLFQGKKHKACPKQQRNPHNRNEMELLVNMRTTTLMAFKDVHYILWFNSSYHNWPWISSPYCLTSIHLMPLAHIQQLGIFISEYFPHKWK